MTDPELPADAKQDGYPVPPTEADDTQGITARRQPGYDAVFAYIRSLDDHMPPDPVHRNALIWRGVNAALDALKIGCCISSHCVEGDHVLIVGEWTTPPVPADAQPEPSDPTQCTGDEGLCPEHGFHRHSLKQPGPDPMPGPAPTPAELRQRYAKAIHRYDYEHGLSGNDIPSAHHRGEADAVLAAIEPELQQLRQQLAEARTALRIAEGDRDAAEEQAVDDPELQQLRAQVARVRGVVADMHGTAGARHWARWLDTVLNDADDPQDPS